jgi:hypothetical protein
VLVTYTTTASGYSFTGSVPVCTATLAYSNAQKRAEDGAADLALTRWPTS